MPVYWRKFNALEVANLLTDYDADQTAHQTYQTPKQDSTQTPHQTTKPVDYTTLKQSMNWTGQEQQGGVHMDYVTKWTLLFDSARIFPPSGFLFWPQYNVTKALR